MLRASIGELTRDLILGVIKSDLHFVWANRGLFKSMDPDSEVKKRERLTKCILKLKDNKLTRVRIESSGSRKPRMLRKSLSLCCPRVELIGTRDWKSGVLAKDLLHDQETTWRNRVGLLRHNCTDTVCSGVYGNREFPRRDCLSSCVLS
ncbi:hypothetical protein F2Q68_00005486 [Brassica cretica]|uniref:Uncharacterized protein n=1 Tax=Brassica cretica TaxID=69181 RepID=A0A8S9J625_BRACR|nr:hypothetical protein F2Q68_00005486 [Brassica cretica]